MGLFGYFGGTENGTWGAQIKILRPLFNTNTPPLKPPVRHFGNHFGPQKSDFWPFYWFWSFSHWNSHWSRKILRTAEGRVVHQKQKLFWKSETKWNNLKPWGSWNSKFHQNKNHPTHWRGAYMHTKINARYNFNCKMFLLLAASNGCWDNAKMTTYH